MLTIKKLSKNYVLSKEAIEKVLKDISLEIPQGEFLAIYGPSGCGKSTLLNIIGGLDQKYEGDVSFQTQRLKNMSEVQLARYRKENIGFVFQNFNLISHISILENILIPLKLNKETKNAEAKALSLLADVGLADFAKKKPAQLSGGQKQRVAIARALVNNPSILIADEPTGALDSESQNVVLDILRKLADKGKTVIVVTHNDEVVKYADRIIHLKDGKIIDEKIMTKVKEAVTEEVQNRYHFTFLKALKIAVSNFKQRKFRNFLVSLGTSIGLTGILLSLGLGAGIVTKINADMNSGKVPTQIQIMPQAEKKGSGILNIDDVNEIKKIVGQENIKYFELPFNITVNKFQIDTHVLDTKDEFPAYAQIKSHYSTTDISVSANTESQLVAGELLKDVNETGISITTQMIDDFNAADNTNMKPSDLIGKKIAFEIIQQLPDGSGMKKVMHETVIKRVLKSEKQKAEENSFMSIAEMDSVIKQHGLQKNTATAVLQLNDPNKNKEISDKLNNTKKYVALSSQGIFDIVIQFIKIIQGLLAFMSSQAVIVAVVMIGIVLYISVIERTREIGVLKAVGYKNFFVAQIFLGEAFLINAIANICGIIFAFSIGSLINYIVSNFITGIGNVYEMQINIVLLVFAISTMLTLLAAIIPSRKAIKLDPATSLRYE